MQHMICSSLLVLAFHHILCKTLVTKNINNHHGFVGVSSSLELNGAKGISGAELGVLAD